MPFGPNPFLPSGPFEGADVRRCVWPRGSAPARTTKSNHLCGDRAGLETAPERRRGGREPVEHSDSYGTTNPRARGSSSLDRRCGQKRAVEPARRRLLVGTLCRSLSAPRIPTRWQARATRMTLPAARQVSRARAIASLDRLIAGRIDRAPSELLDRSVRRLEGGQERGPVRPAESSAGVPAGPRCVGAVAAGCDVPEHARWGGVE